MDVTRTDRRVVTFYSFKGGVGRSMALANVAFRMADRHDLDVIAVDWDLEAPGLHRFFGITDDEAETKTGLLDYLLAWREAVEDDADGPPDATGSLIEITNPKPANGSLKLLLAGKLDRGYSDRLRGFDWLPFYRFNAGAAAIETLRKQLTGQCDMVFVDSRTGVTDAGGICTVQMPDGIVLMTAANEQSFKGIERVGRAIVDGERDRPGRGKPKVWVAVGRAPYLDVPHGEAWFDQYGPRFEAGCQEGLWARADHPRGLRSHRLPHVGRWGFGEQILPTHLEDEDMLALAYGALGDQLIQWALGKEGERPKRTIEELRRAVDVAEKRGDLARLGSALFELGMALSNAGDLAGAAEIFQKSAGIQLGRGLLQSYALALVLLGQVRRDQKRFDDAEDFFRRAVEAAPKYAVALGGYAAFLSGIQKDLDKSEDLYKRAVEADPSNAINLGNYANVLWSFRKDLDKAEAFYERAIEADPQYATHLGNYARFLAEVRKDPDRAEEFYKRAIEADPKSANNLGNYATFLKETRKLLAMAEEFYKRAIEADPKSANNLGNYAVLLWTAQKDPDKAEEFFKRAIDVAPEHVDNLGNYASFIKDVRKDADQAEALYRRAINADPKHARSLGNYADFLQVVRKDFSQAEQFYLRAFEAAPQYAHHLGNYANLLKNIQKDTDQAEVFYRRAIEADPTNAINLGNYATLLWEVQEILTKRRSFYRRALQADPKYAVHLGNYANFLKNVRKNLDQAEELYKRAVDADPKFANNLGNYAGALLALGRQAEGLAMLDRALAAPDSPLDFVSNAGSTPSPTAPPSVAPKPSPTSSA